jgi:hypothetical protein
MEGQPARPPFNIPSPVSLTESDEDAPHSAQDPNVQAEHGGNSDNGEGATISGGPAVNAEMVERQQTVRDESEASYPAYLAEMAEKDAEDVDQDTESETEQGARKRRRN